MSIQELMDQIRPRFFAKWRDRLNDLSRKKNKMTPEDAYKAGYWDGVIDGVDVGTDTGIIQADLTPAGQHNLH